MSDNWDANVDAPPPDFSFETDDLDPNKVGSTIAVDIPGKYHFEISKVREEFDTHDKQGNLRAPSVTIYCTVLHSTPGQSPAGTVYSQHLTVGGKGGGAPEKWMREAAVAFLAGIGLLKEVEGKFIDPATNSPRVDIGSLKTRLINWQFVGWIKLSKGRLKDKNDTSENPERHPDKYELPFGRGAFPIDDEQVRNVPKDLNALKLIGKEHCMPPVAAKDAGKTPAAKSKASAPAKADNPAPAHTPAAPATTVASVTPASGGQVFPAAPAAAGDDGSDLDDL
mgnify:CR=1 FL=1